MENLDDAGVYKLSDDLAIIQTVDFFTPIVDDPYAFGQIAVANALSDVYAMGGKPLTAMNLVCFPIDSMDISILENTLKGGLDKMREAGVVLIGGHSIDDTEMKYGLSVTGTIHPDRLVTSSGAKAGDRLILTKPLGTGIINTAIKAGMASAELIERVTKCMVTLNKEASELMQATGVHACTDVTGFGFLGHAVHLAESSQVALEIHLDAIPYFTEAVDFAQQGLCPAGLFRNRDYYSCKVEFKREVPQHIQDILFDPQTSGGLLICLERAKADTLLKRLKKVNLTEAAIIGEVRSKPQGKVVLI
jgi:selenide,water dikinase